MHNNGQNLTQTTVEGAGAWAAAARGPARTALGGPPAAPGGDRGPQSGSQREISRAKKTGKFILLQNRRRTACRIFFGRIPKQKTQISGYFGMRIRFKEVVVAAGIFWKPKEARCSCTPRGLMYRRGSKNTLEAFFKSFPTSAASFRGFPARPNEPPKHQRIALRPRVLQMLGTVFERSK